MKIKKVNSDAIKLYETSRVKLKTVVNTQKVQFMDGNLIERKEEIDGRFTAPEKKKSNVWSVTKYEHDRNGNITKITTPKGFEILKVYDDIDRVVEQFEKDSQNGIFRSYVYEYDKCSNIISVSEYEGSDAENIHKKYCSEYDYDLNVIERYKLRKADKNNIETERKKYYKYDELNRLTHFTNASGNTTRLFYDKNNRIIKQVLPEQYDEKKR